MIVVDKSIGSEAAATLLQVLRERRHELGLRQADLAKLLDEPQSFVSKYESGERRIDIVELREIASALRWTLRELITTWEEVS